MLRIVRTFVQEWLLQALGELLLEGTSSPAARVGLPKFCDKNGLGPLKLYAYLRAYKSKKKCKW